MAFPFYVYNIAYLIMGFKHFLYFLSGMGNYNLVYAGELSGIHGQSQGEKLNAIFEKFNIDHPADYKGHSFSVSDIVVLHEDGENSARFVDSFGFTKLPDFIKVLEGVKEQENQKAEPEEMQDTSGHDVQMYYKKKPLFMRFMGILKSILPQ